MSHEVSVSDRRRLITLRQAADLCAVDYDTFHRWISKGVIPHVEVGPFHAKRVYLRDVEAMIREVKP